MTQYKWENFSPKTNIYWLRYIYKIIFESTIMRECVGESIKKEVRKIIATIHKCQSLQKLME